MCSLSQSEGESNFHDLLFTLEKDGDSCFFSHSNEVKIQDKVQLPLSVNYEQKDVAGK